jgi:DNA-binding NarL/FixJ family response regulator
MKQHKRLNRDHRIEVEKLIALGRNNKQIATALSVSSKHHY